MILNSTQIDSASAYAPTSPSKKRPLKRDLSESLFWACYIQVIEDITTIEPGRSCYPREILYRHSTCHGDVPHYFTISCGPTQQRPTPGRVRSMYLGRHLLIGFPELDNDPHFFSDVDAGFPSAVVTFERWRDHLRRKLFDGERVGAISTINHDNVSGGLAATSTDTNTTLDEYAIPAMKACWQPQQLTPATDHTVIGYVLHGRQLLAITHDAADNPVIVTFDALSPNRWNVPVGWKFSILRGNTELNALPSCPETQALWGYPELVLDLDHWPAVHAQDPDALAIFRTRLAQGRANLQHPLD